MNFQVRLGNEKDLPFVKELAKECCRMNIPPTRKVSLEPYKAQIESLIDGIVQKMPNSRLLILENRKTQEAVGYLLLLLNQPAFITGQMQAYLVDIAISPENRGKGLWKPLMLKAEELAKENGNFYLFGMITVTNKRSLAMCENLGYRIELYQVCKVLKQKELKRSGG